MGNSSIFLCALFLCGALGLTTSPARGRLHCYTCSFAKPCYPVPTECQDDDACGITVGTSGRSLVRWPLSRLPTCLLPAFPASPSSAFLLHPTDQNEIIER
uniref:Lymphocyte antigen 6 family member G6E n=1 Tax=Sciurus vulgaris TaxID=55149 RepID=A0A8D2DEL0_SCIVU